MAGLRENLPDCLFYRSSLKYGRPKLAGGWFSPQTAPLVRGPHVLILFGRSQFALTKALDCVQTACTRFARPAFGGVAREPAGHAFYRSSRKYGRPKLAGGWFSRFFRREMRISTAMVTR